jgi:putrescine aminotransferase
MVEKGETTTATLKKDLKPEEQKDKRDIYERSQSESSQQKAQKLDYNTLLKCDLDHVVHGLYHPKDASSVIIWQSGSGTSLRDAKGEEYIDGTSGLFCNRIGHGRREITQAVYDQMIQLEMINHQAVSVNVNAIKLTHKIIEIGQRAFPDMSHV